MYVVSVCDIVALYRTTGRYFDIKSQLLRKRRMRKQDELTVITQRDLFLDCCAAVVAGNNLIVTAQTD